MFKAKNTNMTRIQFEQARMAIEQETFESSSCNPFTYGINRNAFDCQKYQRLIALAKKAPGLTARTKLKQWKRQLERSVTAKDRFEKLRAEMRINPPVSLFAVAPSGQ